MLRISSEIACGLEAAHQKRLLHRDIKPANIWLEKNTNRVKILDFGLARAVDSNSGETKFGTLLGTPKYMAPEQAVGKDCDERSDLFSLGCVMYHLATGRPPFGGETVTEVLIQVAREDPVDVRKIAPDVDFAIADLIMGLLSKQPSKRPSCAAEVIAKIERIGKSITQTGNHGAPRIIAGKLRDIRTSLPLKSKLVLVVTVVIISLVGVYLLPSANSLFGGSKTNGEAEIKRKTMSEINPGQSGNYTFNLFDDNEPLVSSVHGHRTQDRVPLERQTGDAIICGARAAP
ncbi:MAG: serine/threonine protein kinase [Mariniblastus sp.]